MSRLATIGDGTATEAAYTCLGADKIVAEDYVEAGVKLDYAHDNLAGLDRFGKSASTAAGLVRHEEVPCSRGTSPIEGKHHFAVGLTIVELVWR
jgi:hypothetical protein